MSESIHDVLCLAEELAQRTVDFYANAAATCEHTMGSDVFDQLREEAEAALGRIAGVRSAVENGTPFATACAMAGEERQELAPTFARMAESYVMPGTACVREVEAAGMAADMEEAAVSFYEEHFGAATDPAERIFLRRLLAESRDHYLLLRDMQSYYEDPEGYMREKSQSGGILDGSTAFT
jgi:rubrerythrin